MARRAAFFYGRGMTYEAPSAHEVRDFLIRQIPLTCAIVGLFALAFGGWDYYAMHRFLDRSEPVEVIVEKIGVELKGKRFGRPQRIKFRIHYRVLADDRRGHGTHWKIGHGSRIGDVRRAFLDPQSGRIYSQARMNK
ncbi:MAG: hypothetical protein AAF666_08665 [Pseudomonadota bacterium]